MKENFDKAWEFTQKWEGGAKITRDPSDPGGTTRYGISQRAHPDLDIENLTEEQAKDIAHEEYWKPAQCDIYLWPMDLVMFDTAFNMGVRGALSMTTGEYRGTILNRVMHYTRLARNNPSLRPYLLGWLNRCYDLLKTVQKED